MKMKRNTVLFLGRTVIGSMLFAVVGGATFADALFVNPVYDTGDHPVSVVSGDFNGDGNEDLATANSYADSVSILLGNGDGTFAAETSFGTGDGPRSVSVGDFDGDMIQDLATANYYSGDVSVLLGNGDGTFATEARFAAWGGPEAVTVGDFNDDGRQDLGVANRNSNDVSILLGNGDGTFAEQTRYEVGDWPRGVAVGNFNGDDRQDLAVANSRYGDGVSILLGNGDGTFAAEMHLPFGGGTCAVSIGDFDDDGAEDLAAAQCESLSVSILLGNGDGTFAAETGFPVSGANPVATAIGDFNNDGRQDLALAKDTLDHVSILLGYGDGTFAAETRLPAGKRAASVAVSDFDNDGCQDMAVAASDSDEINVLLGNGNGTFLTPIHVGGGDAASQLALGDFNGDTIPDLTALTSSGAQALLGTGNGHFTPATPVATEDGRMTAGDLNDDSHLDLVLARGFSDEIGVMLGNGDGSFGEETRIDVTAYGMMVPKSVAIGDFDRDGAADLATANWDSWDAGLFFGEGDGTFGTTARFAVGEGPEGIDIGDFNEDGLQDLVVTNGDSDWFEPNDVSVLLGNGDGTFGAQVRYGTGEAPQRVVVADLSEDGHDDLVVTNSLSGDISVLLGLGNGSFSPEVRYSLGPGAWSPRCIAVGDLDNDGHLDLAVGRRSNYISVLLGLGDGTFVLHGRFGVGRAPTALAIDDFDGDGWNDLAVACAYYGVSGVVGVMVLFNQSGPGPENSPPSADAGLYAAAECSSPSGASIALDGSASSDPDSTPGTNDDIVLFEWFEDFGLPSESLLGTGEMLPIQVALGGHLVTLRVTDNDGETDTDSAVLIVQDTTPPTLSLDVIPSFLWPPNHRMVDIAAAVSAADVCSTPAVVLTTVTSSDPDNAPGGGDGNTWNDVQGVEIGTPDFELQLRSERANESEGRIYTLTYTATDGSGNDAAATAFVIVPHDHGGNSEPVIASLSKERKGTWAAWTAAPEAEAYDVIRGLLSGITETETTIDLGSVTCVEANSTDETTENHEDPETPAPGEGFFYLIKYEGPGGSSSYGTESTEKPRAPANDCP